jgi:hypothetical protein
MKCLKSSLRPRIALIPRTACVVELGVGQVPPGKRGRSYLRRSPGMGEKAPKGPKKDARDPAGICSAHPIILGNQNMGNVIGRDRRERIRECIILGWFIAVYWSRPCLSFRPSQPTTSSSGKFLQFTRSNGTFRIDFGAREAE